MSHFETDNETTKHTIAAIGADDPDSDWILRPEEHAKKLPPEAGALQRVLLTKAHEDTQKRFRAEDALANLAQARYKRAAGRGLAATLIATLIGATLLLPFLHGDEKVRASATVAEYVLLFAAFLVARYLAIVRPFPKWMAARAEAELARIKLFDEVMDAREVPRQNELPLLPLKLEYFRRYQLEVQRRYYGGRGNQHRRAAGHTRRWQHLSLLLSLVVAVAALWASLPLLEDVLSHFRITPPDWLKSLVTLARSHRIADQWLLPLGVAGSAILSYVAARSFMNLDERNASRYLTTWDNLDFLVEQGLDKAREDAAHDNEKPVRAFVQRVQDLISSEHKEWVSLRNAFGGNWPQVKPAARPSNVPPDTSS